MQSFQKNKAVTGKTLFFVLPILFVLILASDKAVLCRNIAFSIFVISTKKRYSSSLKKVFVFQKICFKVTLLKTFEMSSDCQVKICQSLKIPSIAF